MAKPRAKPRAIDVDDWGPKPETPVYSRRTLVLAIELLRQRAPEQITKLALSLGGGYLRRMGGERTSTDVRLNRLMAWVDRQPATTIDNGDLLFNFIVDYAVATHSWTQGLLSNEEEELRRSLLIDGFSFVDNSIRRVIASDAHLPAAENELDALLQKHGFSTTQGHLQQAIDCFRAGHWAAANAQIRSMMDSLLDELAVRLDGSAVSLASGQARRTQLARAGFLSKDLNEWDDNGKGFINGLMRRLHPHGSHPGLSDANDCLFRLQATLMTARLLIVRFDDR